MRFLRLPKRLRWRFGLGFLALLLTTACLVLGELGRAYQQYRVEFQAAQQLQSSKQAIDVEWRRPEWVMHRPILSNLAIFDRVSEVKIKDYLKGHELEGRTTGQPKNAIDDLELIALDLSKFSQLTRLELNAVNVSDAVIEQLIQEHPQWHVELARGYPGEECVNEYLAKRTRHNRQRVSHWLKGWESRPVVRETQGVWSGPCGGVRSQYEELIKKLMRNDRGDLGARAANYFWSSHSFRYASKVVFWVREHKATSPKALEMEAQVEKDLSSNSILAGLKGPDHAWWAYIAGFAPKPEFVPELIRAVDEDRATNETIYALGKSGDPRALDVLLRVAASDHDSGRVGLAIYALKDLTTAAVLEPILIAKFASKDFNGEYAVFRTLAEIGTWRSIGPLVDIMDATADQPTSSAHNYAMAALVKICDREDPDGSDLDWPEETAARD